MPDSPDPDPLRPPNEGLVQPCELGNPAPERHRQCPWPEADFLKLRCWTKQWSVTGSVAPNGLSVSSPAPIPKAYAPGYLLSPLSRLNSANSKGRLRADLRNQREAQTARQWFEKADRWIRGQSQQDIELDELRDQVAQLMDGELPSPDKSRTPSALE